MRMQKKEKKANAIYRSAFKRGFNPSSSSNCRKKALKKKKAAQIKKLAITNQKLAFAIKKKR